jgi:hypothetical protein
MGIRGRNRPKESGIDAQTALSTTVIDQFSIFVLAKIS